MATTQTNQPYKRTLHFKYLAEWRWVDVRASANPAATAFGPPTSLGPDEREPAIALSSPKPVVYMPVKRRNKTETVPSLGIFVSLWEEGSLLNVSVTAHRGAVVKVDVVNVFRGQRLGPVRFEGKLDDHGRCFIRVPADTVVKWLDAEKPSPLGGRINELLLDFTFSCPDLRIDGRPLKGQSINRLYLYRRKVVVFLPGVFGSKVQITTPDGRTIGYPDWYAEQSAFVEAAEAAGAFTAVGKAAWLAKRAAHLANQTVGGLECDAAGRPLLRPAKAFIFTMRGKVYNVFERCREARMAYFGLPEGFHLVELRLFAYDWRGDLTETAVALSRALAQLAEELRRLPDTDDEVAVAGHSTGGVLIRRALGEPGMQDLVSHAFFMNVPLRGAPKALGVALTGKDPVGGGIGARMIPFISPESLSALALSMPIVYHLASSDAYQEQVAFTPSRPSGAAPSVEADKASLIGAALEAGLTAPPQFVKASGLAEEERARLAMGADTWHEYYREAFERLRAQQVYVAAFPSGLPAYNGWFKREMSERGLEPQFAGRATGGWNPELAARASKYHAESETVAASGAWAKKAYVFYSVTKEPTTLSTHLEKVSETEFPNAAALMAAEGIPVHVFEQGEAVPPRGTEEIDLQDGRKASGVKWHQWTVERGRYKRTIWRMYVINQPEAGDSTVPIRSLLGFGGPARVFKPTKKTHPQSTDDVVVWTGVIRALQGVAGEKTDFHQKVDTQNGRVVLD